MMMQKLNKVVLAVLIMGSSALTAAGAVAPPIPAKSNAAQKQQEFSQEEIQKLSEAFGHFIGRNLNNPGIQFDLESVVRGIRNGSQGTAPPMSDQEYEKMMTQLQERAYSKLSEDNLRSANIFMLKNRNAEGVVEVEPGKLQYIVLREGNGPAVKDDGAPQVQYEGKYLDGTVFGSSQEVGGPLTIPLGQTIAGFSKGLVGMKEGEKRRLFVHPDLGYGTKGQLPPNALLIFDVEVIKADTPPRQNPISLNTLPKGGFGDFSMRDIEDDEDDLDDEDLDDEDDLDDEEDDDNY